VTYKDYFAMEESRVEGSDLSRLLTVVSGKAVEKEDAYCPNKDCDGDHDRGNFGSRSDQIACVPACGSVLSKSIAPIP